jgi:hypothetical protein
MRNAGVGVILKFFITSLREQRISMTISEFSVPVKILVSVDLKYHNMHSRKYIPASILS